MNRIKNLFQIFLDSFAVVALVWDCLEKPVGEEHVE